MAPYRRGREVTAPRARGREVRHYGSSRLRRWGRNIARLTAVAAAATVVAKVADYSFYHFAPDSNVEHLEEYRHHEIGINSLVPLGTKNNGFAMRYVIQPGLDSVSLSKDPTTGKVNGKSVVIDTKLVILRDKLPHGVTDYPHTAGTLFAIMCTKFPDSVPAETKHLTDGVRAQASKLTNLNVTSNDLKTLPITFRSEEMSIDPKTHLPTPTELDLSCATPATPKAG